MALQFYNWSKVAATNATADAAVNWQEGQAPSSVNDSARAMMASVAAYRDDLSGVLVTGGTSTAYTLATNQAFDTLAHFDGKVIAFTPHTTNGAGATLIVDGLGTAPLRIQPGVNLQSGVLVQGTPYAARFSNSDGAFYLFGVGPDPGIPLGASIDYWGATAPTTSFALANGQNISRTIYSALFALIGTNYSAGDGSTTFGLPDCRGRVVAAQDDMGGVPAGRLTSFSGLGGAGGSETKTLATANLPPYTPSGSIAVVNGAITSDRQGVVSGGGVFNTSGGTITSGTQTLTQQPTTATFTGTAQGGTSTPINLTQPTIIANKLIRII